MLRSFDDYYYDVHVPIVYPDDIRGGCIRRTKYLGNNLVEVEMADGKILRLYEHDFRYGLDRGYYALLGVMPPNFNMAGSPGATTTTTTPVQPGSVLTYTTDASTSRRVTEAVDKLVEEYNESPDSFPPLQKPRNTMKRVYYHNRLRKKS